MIRMITRFFRSGTNCAEISEDRVLQFFGACLALTHVFTYFYWSELGNRLLRAQSELVHVCWPIYPNCGSIQTAPEWLLKLIMSAYLVLGLVDVILFLFKRSQRPAYLLAVVLLVLKLGIFLQDYRMMGNYHYMLYWVQFIFLFVPDKKRSLMLLIPLFYFSAGLLKFNEEWLSGATLPRELPFSPPAKLVEWMCAYVPVLEMVFIWGLLEKKRWIFWLTLSQLILFHTVSYFIVGIFYPVVMLSLLSIFVFARWFSLADSFQGVQFVGLKRAAQLVIALFCIAQLTPYLYSGDSALTGQGRMLSLNMLDARTQCEAYIYMKFRNQSVLEVPRAANNYALRIFCDPLVQFSEARYYCDLGRQKPNFSELDIGLNSKRRSDEAFTNIFTIRDFCHKNSYIDFFGGIHE
jgi:hypothetical protein